MKKYSLFAQYLVGILALAGCGGNSTPPPTNISFNPAASITLDVGQSAPITATASGGQANQGFDWTLRCQRVCGSITPHTANGAPATYTATTQPSSESVTIFATLTGTTNAGGTSATVSLPPTVATTGAITAATLGSPYSLQLAANDGAGNLTWALGGGTSLPDSLTLSGTGMITGTPSGTSGTFKFNVHVTDSGNPPQTSPDVQLSITVGAAPNSVSLSQNTAVVALNGTTKFTATVTNGQPGGNVDWTLTLNGVACTGTECGSVSSSTTASGSPTTYTAPANVPSANVSLIATTVSGNPPASAAATITITAHGFFPTGSMGASRESHTATLLDFGSQLTNGKVLVTGGVDSNKQVLSSAELFDPANGTFTPTKGSMNAARAFHTATLLNDGTVLVTGGLDGNTELATAEIFDPESGTFTPTKGAMESPQAHHVATLLKDGTVLITGESYSVANLGTSELFDPASGMFTPTKGSMSTARPSHAATLLDHGAAITNGQVLLTGGETATAELFDPVSGSFTSTGTMESKRSNHTATLLNDGTVLVTGGDGVTRNPTGAVSAKAELFNPTSGIFTPTNGNLTTPRANHTATLLDDGTVVLAGGWDLIDFSVFNRSGTVNYLATAEVFDPASGLFALTVEMTTPRVFHTATLLKDGRVLMTGGADSSGAPLATAELFQ